MNTITRKLGTPSGRGPRATVSAPGSYFTTIGHALFPVAFRTSRSLHGFRKKEAGACNKREENYGSVLGLERFALYGKGGVKLWFARVVGTVRVFTSNGENLRTPLSIYFVLESLTSLGQRLLVSFFDEERI